MTPRSRGPLKAGVVGLHGRPKRVQRVVPGPQLGRGVRIHVELGQHRGGAHCRFAKFGCLHDSIEEAGGNGVLG